MLSQNQLKYLKLAISQSKANNNPTVTLKAKNANDLYNLSTALNSLKDKGLIVPISDNFFKSNFNVLTDREFKFAITEELLILYQEQTQK